MNDIRMMSSFVTLVLHVSPCEPYLVQSHAATDITLIIPFVLI